MFREDAWMQEAFVGCGRVRLAGWTSRDDVWLIDDNEATRDEKRDALPPREASRWLQTFAPSLGEATLRAVEGGRSLVVARTLWMPSFESEPEGTPLVDLAG